MDSNNDILIAEEAAPILRVKVGTVYDWVAKGILPHIRILAGRRRAVIRFRRSDLEEFIRQRANPGRKVPR